MNGPLHPKRPVQLELDEESVARAEAQGVNLSRVLAEAVAARLAAAPTPAERRARAEAHARFTAAYIAQHGRWGEEFDSF